MFSGNERILFSWSGYKYTIYAKLISYYLFLLVVAYLLGVGLSKFLNSSKIILVLLCSMLALSIVALIVKMYFDNIIYYTSISLLQVLIGVILGILISSKKLFELK